ncbi:hypothetical protein PYCC9005_005531 [Savitreella phatthalungensis]
MENVRKELREVVLALTENDDPVSHKATVDRFFVERPSFVHPLAVVASGEGSRERLKRVYGVYKYLTRDVEIKILSITIGEDEKRAVIDLEESLSIRYVPLFRVRRLKIITVLELEKSKKDGKVRIAAQYDAFPIDAASQVLPLGFLYGWWKLAAGTTGGVVGAVLDRTGLW